MKSPPLALYVHFPWCVQKCPYCDFNSYTLKERAARAALRRRAAAGSRCTGAGRAGRAARQHFSRRRHAEPVFSRRDRAVSRARAHARWVLPIDIEITLEANPGTIERGRFAEYRAAGVTRVSLGAQSFDRAQLKALGRIHSADETRRAAEELHAAGLDELQSRSDVRAAGQTAADAEADLRAALALAPAHISHYHLTIEPGTLFAAAPPTQPADDIVEEMLDRSLRSLGATGFEQYEVSGYARAGARCAHNLNYWNFGDYLGIGAGAHGKISDPSRELIFRTQQTREPRRYLAADPERAGAQADLDPGSAVRIRHEWLPTGGGLFRELFEARTGLDAGVLERALVPVKAQGLVERQSGRWRATPKGFRFLNDILVDLLPDAEPRAPAEVPAPRLGVFMHRRPMTGRKQGDYARFQSCCTIK